MRKSSVYAVAISLLLLGGGLYWAKLRMNSILLPLAPPASGLGVRITSPIDSNKDLRPKEVKAITSEIIAGDKKTREAIWIQQTEGYGGCTIGSCLWDKSFSLTEMNQRLQQEEEPQPCLSWDGTHSVRVNPTYLQQEIVRIGNPNPVITCGSNGG
jgi:hypothetical protein